MKMLAETPQPKTCENRVDGLLRVVRRRTMAAAREHVGGAGREAGLSPHTRVGTTPPHESWRRRDEIGGPGNAWLDHASVNQGRRDLGPFTEATSVNPGTETTCVPM